ncbi:MAG: antitoxin component YwqK of YwqJK toxin-antitoxin module [Flavobacteriaceae bacterium]
MNTKALQILFNRLAFAGVLFFASCDESATPADMGRVSFSDLILDQNEGTHSYKAELFTGVGVKKYPNGKISKTTEFNKGEKHGEMKKWFEDGSLSYEASYSNGRLNGTEKSWWINGNLRSISHFQKGIPKGSQKEWYLEGQKFTSKNISNRREKGMQKAWRRNGTLYVNYEAKNGRNYGMRKANMCYDVKDEKVQSDEK